MIINSLIISSLIIISLSQDYQQMSRCFDNCRTVHGYLSKNRLVCCKSPINYTNKLDQGDCQLDDIIMDIQDCDAREISTMKNE